MPGHTSGGLSKWFRQNWVDISRPKKGGGYAKCGRPKAKKGRKGYPKCVPAAKAARMSKAQIRSAVRRKRSKHKEFEVNLQTLKLLLNVRGRLEEGDDSGSKKN